MSVTFGSVGDIIAVSLLVKDLISSLDENCGSAAEFRDVIRELHVLDRALLQIEQLARRYKNTPELMALFVTAQKAVADCQGIIGEFLENIHKYRKSLGKDSTSDVFSKAARKVQWAVAQKKELASFRAKVATHTESLTMLMATASVNVLALCEENVKSQMRTDTASTHSMMLDIDSRLAENTQLITSTNTAVKGLAEVLKLQWLRDFTLGIKAMVQKVLFVNVATYHAVQTIQQKLPSATERAMALFQEPVILEDAIGRIAPVHLQFITSWTIFDTVMAQRFENIPGYEKIQRKQYVLQDRITRREIRRTRPFSVSFLPGQKVDMSLIFRTPVSAMSYLSSCPGCRYCPDEARSDIDVECDNCGMMYHRITDVTNTKDYIPDNIYPLRAITPPRAHNAAIQNSPSNKYGNKRTPTEAKLDDSDPCAFKRVRIAPYVDSSIPDMFHLQWWISNDGIHPEVIQETINCYCGPEASVREGFGVGKNKHRPGYWISAFRGLTRAMLQDVRQYSRDLASKQHLQEIEEIA